MDSFSRQLNIYGFKRISDSRKQKTRPSERTSAFHNPNFIRGRPDLLHLIARTKNPRKPSKESEPKHDSTMPVNLGYPTLTSNSTPQMSDVNVFTCNSSPHTNTTTGMFDLPVTTLPFYPPQPFLPTNPYYTPFQDNISNNLFTYAYPNEFNYFYYPSS
ncbi:Heat shock transcription factor [Entomophthora muscae]|uniref:Heat shock transcription factor n=2 Tax=Entomophthora muscae TaxID=34485 RepID=A0ACC2RR34_9FUNG|nr:Heat shock transcription factor [Entomophthora muscae]KAJ9073127.1 Heat shock transcription factor [Entomophthora muscae]